MALPSHRLHAALTWFRLLACGVAGLALLVLLFIHRPVVHTVTADTEFLHLTLAQPLRLGSFAVDLRANESLAGCARPVRASVPPGTQLTGARRSDRNTTYVEFVNRTAPIELACAGGPARSVDRLVIDHDAQQNPKRPSPLAERPLMLRVAGLGTLGDELRDHSAPQQLMPLREARITTEAREWFGDAYVRLGERTVDAGSRLILGRGGETQDQAGSAALGFLAMEREHFKVTLRHTGDVRVLLPWADAGQPIVVTPSALDALKGQVQWGWVLVVVPVLLALLDALDKVLQARAAGASPRADAGLPRAPSPPPSPSAPPLPASPPPPPPPPPPAVPAVANPPPVPVPARAPGQAGTAVAPPPAQGPAPTAPSHPPAPQDPP